MRYFNNLEIFADSVTWSMVVEAQEPAVKTLINMNFIVLSTLLDELL